jgi:hypothetical protein
MAALIFNRAKKKLLDAGINLGTDTIKLALFTNSYTPNIDTDEFFSGISANQVAAGNGYTSGGVALANKATTVDTTDDKGVFDADDVVFTLTGPVTFRYAVLYKDTGNSATSPLIMVEDVGAAGITAQAGLLTFQFNAEGIINLN